ncbi:hypothetical protein HOG21_05085 [bacterium]|nr:hypothetical protein [bacterium]
MIARYISKNTNIKLEKNLIKKIKTTRQQAILSREQRLKNLKNAFKIANNKIDNFDKKIFIIVDDVISTGSTINEISKVLKKA